MLKTFVYNNPIPNAAILGCARRNVWSRQIRFGPIISSSQVCLQPCTRLALCLKITIVSVSPSFPLQSPPISRLPSPRWRLILDTVLIPNPSGRFDLRARYSVLMKVNTAHQSSRPPSHRAVPFCPTGGGLGSPAAGQ